MLFLFLAQHGQIRGLPCSHAQHRFPHVCVCRGTLFIHSVLRFLARGKLLDTQKSKLTWQKGPPSRGKCLILHCRGWFDVESWCSHIMDTQKLST